MPQQRMKIALRLLGGDGGSGDGDGNGSGGGGGGGVRGVLAARKGILPHDWHGRHAIHDRGGTSASNRRVGGARRDGTGAG